LFSYIDLVRLAIALEVGERFGVDIAREEFETWRTLGDVARSVVARDGGTATEAQVFEWLRARIVEDCGATELAELTADGDVFSDYDRATAWFNTLGRDQREPASDSTKMHAYPYYCAYGAPSDLTVLPSGWRTDAVVSLAQRMSASLDFSALPKLADALQDAGCNDTDGLHRYMLYHCRDPVATHVHGCWVVDLVLGKGRYRAEPEAPADSGRDPRSA
jgi:hypothetical protein